MTDFLDRVELTLSEQVANAAADALIEWAKEQSYLKMLVETELNPLAQIYPIPKESQ